jgi:hypothetical protein
MIPVPFNYLGDGDSRHHPLAKWRPQDANRTVFSGAGRLGAENRAITCQPVDLIPCFPCGYLRLFGATYVYRFDPLGASG